MPDPLPPRQYVVRTPSGDPAAVRRLAAAYDDLADDLTVGIRRAVTILHDLAFDWRGGAADAMQRPEQALTADGARVTGALRRCAEELRLYAHRLERAHEHHGWSLGRLVAMGAMVTVGVAAVVVTVGAAAPAEAAAAAAAVEAAEAATTTASAAGTTASAGLDSWQALLTGMRPLLPFVAPHIMSAGASLGLDAAAQLLDGHRLDLRSLEVSAAVGFAGSSVGAATERRLAAARPLTRRAAESAVWAADGTAGEYADTGQVDPADSAAFALTGVVARDVRRGVDAVPGAIRRLMR